jgi:hypothetical protein
MHVATIEVIGHHRLGLQLLAELISTGEAQRLKGQGVEAIAAAALSGGIIAWEKATAADLAQMITVIREAIGEVEEDSTPTAADLAEEPGAEPVPRVWGWEEPPEPVPRAYITGQSHPQTGPGLDPTPA